MVKLPENASQGVVDEPVSTRRIMPTILDACGLDIPEDAPVSGAGTLIPREESEDEDKTEPVPVFCTGCLYFEPREAVVMEGFKFIRGLDTGAEALYDLTRDPGETENVADKQQRLVIRARAALDAHREAGELLKDHYDTRNADRFKLNDDTIKRLKSLGYL
jgi:arylsulfatase A-like enzyme